MLLPPFQLTLTLSANAALASFQTGYYLSIINNPVDVLQSFTNASFYQHYGYFLNESQLTSLWAFIVASFYIGGILGSWCTNYVVDSLGRSFTIMILNNLIAIISCLMSAFCKMANSFELLTASRFLMGFNAGIATGATGIYLTECSPIPFRGFFGCLFNFFISLFVLLSSVLSMNNVLGTEALWPYLLALGLIPGILQIILYPFYFDTPKHLLLTKKDDIKARRSILFYYGRNANVEEALEEFRREQKLADKQIGLMEAVRDQRFRFPLILSSVINLAIVSTGVIAIFSYSSSIFESVGFPADKAQLISTIMSLFNLIGGLAGLFLIENWGRRPLLLWGTFICLCCDIFFMILNFVFDKTLYSWLGYVCAAILVTHVTVFTMSGGNIEWFISSELMPQQARAIGAALSITVNWFLSLVTSFAFDPLNDLIQSWSFLLFIVPLVPSLIYVWWKMPETKNRHIDEIMAHWLKK